MLRSSFQARISGVLILLLLVVIGALYVAVKAATDAAVRAQAQEQLNVGSLVFEQLLALRSDQLQQAAQVLAADFGFKEAVASGDAPTIRSALA
ncbi:MAG: cache domain-containing protein, partial [Pseudomonas sp.]